MRVELNGRFWADPRISDVGLAAAGLYVRAISFAASKNLNPTLESSTAAELKDLGAKPRHIRALIAVGLVTALRDSDGYSYLFEASGDLWVLRAQRESIPARLRREVADRDEGVCQLCGDVIVDGEATHIDHRLPVLWGGRTVLDNLQLAHAICNLKKGARV